MSLDTPGSAILKLIQQTEARQAVWDAEPPPEGWIRHDGIGGCGCLIRDEGGKLECICGWTYEPGPPLGLTPDYLRAAMRPSVEALEFDAEA